MNFSEEGWIEVAAKLCQEVHDARKVALVVIGLLVPFESENELSNYVLCGHACLLISIMLKPQQQQESMLKDVL